MRLGTVRREPETKGTEVMQYKVRDWQPGEALVSRSLSDNRLLELEEALFFRLREEIPADAVVVIIDLKVKYHAAKKPGEPVPADVEMFQYKVSVRLPIEPKKEE